MTADELHKLVRDWPKGALPRPENTIGEANHDAPLHIASGLVWLLRSRAVLICPPDDRIDAWTVSPGVRLFPGPTLLHAISAAIRAQKGAEKA